MPKIAALREISSSLDGAGITHALGGSGLLVALGLTDTAPPPRDWDITTDADPETVAAALAPFKPTRIEPNGPYATAAMFRFTLDGAPFDVMSRFAIRHDRGLWKFPTIIDGAWQGVPLCRPEPWLVAYALLRRGHRAATIRAHLGRVGVDRSILPVLDLDSLPEPILTGLI